MLGWIKLKRDELPKLLKFIGIKESLNSIESRNTTQGWTTTIKDGKYKVVPSSHGLLITAKVNFIKIHQSSGRGDPTLKETFKQEYNGMVEF